MSLPYNAAAVPGTHSVTYRTRDAHRGNPARTVEVLATPDEIQGLLRDGYLVRSSLLLPEDIERLRDALDECEAREATDNGERGSKSFGGTFLRHLADKHPAFLEMIDFAPVLSVARAVLGPSVSLRGFTARICRPGDQYSEVEWHFHQRMIPDPLPPVFTRPQTLDALLYLDDIDARNGPLCVLPGSHEWIEQDLPTGDVADKPGEQVLTLPAGSLVLAFGSLWHRALPTDGQQTRRLLLFGYSAAWQKPAIYGKKPDDGLTTQLLRQPDISDEMRELLGVAGYM